jgi:hypothetical protein
MATVTRARFEALEGLVEHYGDHRPTEPDFGTPFIDEDEQRDWPVPQRYFYGGLMRTRTLFSFHLPKAARNLARVPVVVSA